MSPNSSDCHGAEADGRRQPVTLELSVDEALVLFDWLARTSQASAPASFDDPAEQQVLWNLECALERVFVEPLSPEYRSLLQNARRAVAAGEGGGD